MILILSNKWDVTVDFVVEELRNRGYPYLRINTEDLSKYEVTTELPDFSIEVETDNQTVDLAEDVGAVWYRRPGEPFEFSDDDSKPSEEALEYIREQWSAWIQSLQTIPDTTWVNHPDANHRMESKVRQLNLANEVGFEIPDTVVTNSRSSAAEIFERQDGEIVSKALSSPLISGGSQDEFVFTVDLEESPAEVDEESLRLAPSIFQESILPKIDHRVTVIGEEVFPVRIEAEEDAEIPVDWRTEKDDVRFIEDDLPIEVEELCRTYVDVAGLQFGAIDLVERDGEYVFLEINPNGEWGWLQKPWGVPIAETLSDFLIQLDGGEVVR
jgi:glutathione synthase/RimK-type ligase-like ATP-grasp enzyme